MKNPKKPQTDLCWGCFQRNPTHILPGVRLVKCPNPDCRVVHPASTKKLVHLFFNPDKVAISLRK